MLKTPEELQEMKTLKGRLLMSDTCEHRFVLVSQKLKEKICKLNRFPLKPTPLWRCENKCRNYIYSM